MLWLSGTPKKLTTRAMKHISISSHYTPWFMSIPITWASSESASKLDSTHEEAVNQPSIIIYQLHQTTSPHFLWFKAMLWALNLICWCWKAMVFTWQKAHASHRPPLRPPPRSLRRSPRRPYLPFRHMTRQGDGDFPIVIWGGGLWLHWFLWYPHYLHILFITYTKLPSTACLLGVRKPCFLRLRKWLVSISSVMV